MSVFVSGLVSGSMGQPVEYIQIRIVPEVWSPLPTPRGQKDKRETTIKIRRIEIMIGFEAVLID